MSFFDRIGNTLTDAGQNITQKAKNLTEITQLENAISKKEKRISSLFQAIGQSYYKKHKDDPEAESIDCISEINTLYADISENREKIRQISGVTKCESCGANLPINSVFCSVCGAKASRTEPAPATAKKARICPACQTAAEEDDLYCTCCGQKFEADSVKE